MLLCVRACMSYLCSSQGSLPVLHSLPAVTPRHLYKNNIHMERNSLFSTRTEKHDCVGSPWQNSERWALDANGMEHLDQRDKSDAAALQSLGWKYPPASLRKLTWEMHGQGPDKRAHYTYTLSDCLKSNAVLLQHSPKKSPAELIHHPLPPLLPPPPPPLFCCSSVL